MFTQEGHGRRMNFVNPSDFVPEKFLSKFEFHSYNHAIEIITQAFPEEWEELLVCLDKFQVTTQDLIAAGGNETKIPQKIEDVLYPFGWKEIKITGDLIVKKYLRHINQRNKFSETPFEEEKIEGYIDGHNVDFIKNRIAFDLEWNSKDQTFDRDLFAMRTYYDCNVISAGIILTRSEELNDLFKELLDSDGKSILRKYGASTTWMGKLLPRLNARRNGGCPVLAIGMKKTCIID